MESRYSRLALSALVILVIYASGAVASCPFASGLFGGVTEDGDGRSGHLRRAMPDNHNHQFLRRMEPLSDGLLNEGKGCWGFCNMTAGDCDYCGTGQCCRDADYRNGVEGCELAQGLIGSKCGNWKGEVAPTLRNEGLACFGACNNTAGDCDYCGTGQCCRQVDGERCVPGCELAATNWIEGPASQCGSFASTELCEPTTPTVNDPLPTNDGGDGVTEEQDPTQELTGGLMHEGQACGGRCNFQGGDCDWCGTGQCCDNNDWYRGVPGCELAEGYGTAVCGEFSAPYNNRD